MASFFNRYSSYNFIYFTFSYSCIIICLYFLLSYSFSHYRRLAVYFSYFCKSSLSTDVCVTLSASIVLYLSEVVRLDYADEPFSGDYD